MTEHLKSSLSHPIGGEALTDIQLKLAVITLNSIKRVKWIELSNRSAPQQLTLSKLLLMECLSL